MKPVLALTIGALAVACLIACNDSNPVTPGEPAVLGGKLVDAFGTRVSGAVVRVFTTDHLPKPEDAAAKTAATRSLAFLALTDSNGAYSLPGLAPGLYNIIAEKDGLASIRDSIFLSQATREIPEDTLRATGSFSGSVGIEPEDDARLFLVQVLGTPWLTYPDVDGKFVLSGLPQGSYSVRILSPKPEYRNQIFRVSIRAAKHDTAPEPLSPVFTGIPVVKGIRVTVDTLRGTAKVRWNAPDYPRIGSVQIEREVNDIGIQVFTAKNSADTEFTDTLFPGRGFADTLIQRGSVQPPLIQVGIPPVSIYPDTAPLRVSYRVVLVDRGGVYGPLYEKATATVPPPETVRTEITFGDGKGYAYVAIGDSGTVHVRFRNRTRKLKSITWTDTLGNQLRSVTASDTAGEDSLRFEAKGAAGYITFRARIKDDAGTTWVGETEIEVVSWKRLADRPMPAYGAAGVNPVHLPTVSAGGKLYVFGSRGEFSFSASSSYDPATGKWSAIAPPPFLGHPLAVGNAVYMVAGDSLAAYDPAADAWNFKGLLAPGRGSYLDGKEWVVGPYIVAGACCDGRTFSIFDTETRTLSQVQTPDYPNYYYPVIATRSELLLPNSNGRMIAINPASGSVQDKTTLSMSSSSLHAGLNGYHYFLPLYPYGAAIDVYDEDRNTWKTEPGLSGNPSVLVPADGKLYALSLMTSYGSTGSLSWSLSVTTHVPGSAVWKFEASIPLDRPHFEAAVVGGEVYVVGYTDANQESKLSLPVLFRIP